jgi:hypothetical protein
MHLLNILLATLSTNLPAAQAQRTFPAPISLHNITYGGSGCPADSVISVFDSSLLSLQLKTTRHNVRLGKDISVSQNRKNCQIRAEILVPANYSITIWQRHVSGTAQLSEGVSAQFLATVYLTGELGQVTVSMVLLHLNLHLYEGTADYFIPIDTEGTSECNI